MPDNLNEYYFLYYLLMVTFSVLITLLSIPSILHVARTRHLYDDVGHFRKQHDHGIPRLGGVAIFVSFTITLLLFSIIDKNIPVSYILTASIILFIMGIKDDLSGVNSSTKFLIQFVVAAILVILGDIRLSSMYGIFGMYDISYIFSVVISILFIILVINAFNLIDGIDGLAATTCIVANGAFTVLFMYLKHFELAAVSITIVGAVCGFLRYNLTPAKIFMGDAGSLLIGLISAIMAVKFIELNKFTALNTPEIVSAPAITFAILMGPIFDTLRVFTLRIVNGKSPFTADRNHIHHRILRLGYTHLQTTFILTGVNVLLIILVFRFANLGNFTLIVFILLVSMLFNWGITFCLRSKERENLSLRNLFI
ncbi:MraY family glycosyltransferase [Mucilaginibacter phyllosphaerae]|uniref:UDP-N-acetylmuramyl pentapeptide phosphotransferase/UDP-N-acetylglucosamine-1-phosphate transferase n=1 Tax=Mucilaginibacter phyllosphaerae TaxID=1812349 RepID=A0A4Y8AGE6_9SPHI|nr:MraY family glycosyltransferase [Mucilaginibacter phyllosphaerae]MBB3968532.1 UDP-N-acetylmuramyl pentapeptide phosphotransferase/UDP-N-acetylglucosamine-1-phosphate transferase [Mucilaginibacter phyllosphaerae]TEW67826.1 undecaprenyl/decaprenyl-phosphate alpha-N-acetylglucosaminyl 1-phosphate transferase [Mucilaginibacter phyllosphaerae]GGH15426.1 undecaprenyl-phosphate alpha-N-acetylglucosaminyl 1-phosphate transferase [Mucilaginibacter phyllosphaerae]